MDKKNIFSWLLPSGLIALLVPLMVFILVVTLARGDFNDGVTEIAFSIGNTRVAWYGIMIFVGFITAITLGCLKLWKLYKVSVDPFYWYCIMAIPGAIFGARIWSFIIGDATGAFFAFQNGGLAIEGGVVLDVIIACLWFPYILKKPRYQIRDTLSSPEQVRQVSFWVYADAIIPVILIGQVIGRYGNYMNQELYGDVITSDSWANFIVSLFPYMKNMHDAGNVDQPLFLYESFANWWAFILLYFVAEFIPKKRCGDLSVLYFVWYGTLRLSIEPLRNSEFTFVTTYIMSAIWVAVGVILLLLNHLIFWRIRKYKVTHTIFKYIKILFLYRFTSLSLDFSRNKLAKLTNNRTGDKTDEEKELHQEKTKTINTKIIHLSTKLNDLISIKQNLTTRTVRKEEEMLYYLGR